MPRLARPHDAPRSPTPVSRHRRMLAAVDERLGLDAIRYPVPEHGNSLAWSLGGLTAATFLLLVATGIVLAQFYDPVPEVANQSIRRIMQDVLLGRFIRSLHYWAAQAMIVLAALHLLRVFFHGSYKRPREANWLIGVAMFGLTVGGIFTGTVLKWDQEGYEALTHNVDLAELLGGAGFWFSADFAEGTPLLVRLYSAHIMLIPGLIVVLLTLHALLIKRHGISPHPALTRGAMGDDTAPTAASLPAPRTPDEPEPAASEPVQPFTMHLRRLAAFGLVLLSGLTLLSVLFPPPVGPTPVAGIEVTKPPMLFWWLFTLENWVGLSGIMWGTGVLFAILIAVPFVDRNPERHWRRRPVAMAAAIVVLVVLALLTLLMAVTPAAEHLA